MKRSWISGRIWRQRWFVLLLSLLLPLAGYLLFAALSSQPQADAELARIIDEGRDSLSSSSASDEELLQRAEHIPVPEFKSEVRHSPI